MISCRFKKTVTKGLIDHSNDQKVSIYSPIMQSSRCVLVLIGYRIDLLLFVLTNRVVPLF
jgi:hypothetical protein